MTGYLTYLLHILPDRLFRGIGVSGILIVLSHVPVVTAVERGSELPLETAVKLAQANDPWLVRNRHSQDAVESMSIFAGTLPDPKISIGLENLATDTFDFNQETMTQLKVGVFQMFPRGNTLELRRAQLELTGTQFPYQRQERKGMVMVTVSNLWLDAFKAQESIALIEKNRTLFEQLVDVARASYSSALGMTRLQDIVRAQLELTQLEDRLTTLHQQQEIYQQRLLEWLGDISFYREINVNDGNLSMYHSVLKLPSDIPDIQLINPGFYTQYTVNDQESLAKHLLKHPSLIALDKKIQAASKGIDIAKQKYKPEWGINASYGYRGDDLTGADRADLLSIGISFDVPLFTANRQDREVQSAISETEAVKTEKWLLLRRLMASFEAARVQLDKLNQRRELYQSVLLPQMHEQAEASLTAYTNDDGDFAEVVRSRIAELNAEIEALTIDVERQKTIVQLNYFFLEADAENYLTDNRSVSGDGR